MADDHVSRRDFFKTVGDGSVATAVVGGVNEGPAHCGHDGGRACCE